MAATGNSFLDSFPSMPHVASHTLDTPPACRESKGHQFEIHFDAPSVQSSALLSRLLQTTITHTNTNLSCPRPHSRVSGYSLHSDRETSKHRICAIFLRLLGVPCHTFTASVDTLPKKDFTFGRSKAGNPGSNLCLEFKPLSANPQKRLLPLLLPHRALHSFAPNLNLLPRRKHAQSNLQPSRTSTSLDFLQVP